MIATARLDGQDMAVMFVLAFMIVLSMVTAITALACVKKGIVDVIARCLPNRNHVNAQSTVFVDAYSSAPRSMILKEPELLMNATLRALRSVFLNALLERCL